MSEPVPYLLTGLMSGTSLDGIDLASCRFAMTEEGWTFSVMAAETLPYPAQWREKLREAYKMGGADLVKLHVDYGRLLGANIRSFHEKYRLPEGMVAVSHGHTVFHRPEQGYSFQLGHGAAIAAASACTVVCDLRSMDVALGGQGAPLVPLGDKHLFAPYDACLNLGGFANISYDAHGRRMAFDICPLNYVSNHLVQDAHLPGTPFADRHRADNADGVAAYDPAGNIGRRGQIHGELLDKLNKLAFYRAEGPKSLGREWVDTHIWPLLQRFELPLQERLRTWYEHAAIQLSAVIRRASVKKVLVTGGGVHNTFLMECIQRHLPAGTEVVVPDREVIEFKEAIVFAFLGLLCLQGQNNCLASATGARQDSIGGSIHPYPRSPFCYAMKTKG